MGGGDKNKTNSKSKVIGGMYRSSIPRGKKRGEK